MGERNISLDAIVLSIKEMGETNRQVTFFSAEQGIIYATLYGGARSKMRSLVQTFNSGRLYLYCDESKKQNKIVDFDVKKVHSTFNSSLYKMTAANLASEILVKTKGAEDWEKSFTLINAFVDGMDISSENEAKIGTIRFLWRYIQILGLQPEIHLCGNCQKSLLDFDHSVFYPFKSKFLCASCEIFFQLNQNSTGITSPYFIDKDGITYLNAINTLSPGQVRQIQISDKSMNYLKVFLMGFLEQITGEKLKTLEILPGIL